jgi:hypothetical protein
MDSMGKEAATRHVIENARSVTESLECYIMSTYLTAAACFY